MVALSANDGVQGYVEESVAVINKSSVSVVEVRMFVPSNQETVKFRIDGLFSNEGVRGYGEESVAVINKSAFP